MAKRATTHTRGRVKGRKPVSKALALAKRVNKPLPKGGQMVVATPPLPALAPPAEVGQFLTDDAFMATYGTAEVALTAAEEKVLAEPVNRLCVEVKPTGQPYLPHTEYAKWLDRAFGRTGWTLRPLANPRKVEETKGEKTRIMLQQPFALFVHGKMIAFAYGGAEYHENSAEQTYDDVIESLNAYGLRRCCKRLRIGLELWDRRWVRQWVDEFTDMVKVTWSNKPQWRRKGDPKLRGETGPWRGGGDSTPGSDNAHRTAGRSTSTEPISAPQLNRLIAIAKRHAVIDTALKAFLAERYPYTVRPGMAPSKKLIRRCDYDAIVEAVEAGLRAPQSEAPVVSGEVLDAHDRPVVTADDIEWDDR